MDYQVLAIRTRPQSFDQVVGQEPIVTALTHALNQNKLHHAYLFTGTRGVGKTTIARILAKAMNCEQGVSANPCNKCDNCVAINEGKFTDLIEIDAASKTKVEDTRALLDTVIYSPTQGRCKIYLIDEVHMLSTHSFNALLKTLEEPPSHVKFLLATTDPQKLPATIVSRCLQFTLKWVSQDVIVKHLEHILAKDGVSFEIDALGVIAQAANGSIRDSLSLLEQAVAHGAGVIKSSQVRAMLGSIAGSEVISLLTSVVNEDTNDLVQKIYDLTMCGVDFSQVITQLIYALHNITIIQQAPEVASIKTMELKQDLYSLAEQITPEDIQVFYQMALLAKRDLPYSPEPKLALEMALLRMAGFRTVNTTAINNNSSHTDKTSDFKNSKSSVSSIKSKSAINHTQLRNDSEQSLPKSSIAPVVQAQDTKHASNLEMTGAKEDMTDSSKSSETSASPAADLVNSSAKQVLPTKQNWGDWINTLSLSGILLQIVKNTEFIDLSNDKLILKLDSRAKPLVNQKRIDDIENNVRQYLNSKVKVVLEYADARSNVGDQTNVSSSENNQVQNRSVVTPAKLEQQEKQEKQEKLVVKLQSDPNIKSIMKTFNGELQLNSVELLDEPTE